MELGSRTGEVEPRVVLGEEGLVAAVLPLRRSLDSGRQPLQRLCERLTDHGAEPPVEDVGLLELAEREAPLGEDRPGVEFCVHAMERDAHFLVARPDRPGDRERAAVQGQERRVAVEPAEARHCERVGRDLPREAHADDEIGLHRGEQGRDGAPARRQEDVEVGRGGEHEVASMRDGAVAAVGVPRRQERDHLVSRLPHDGVEAQQHRRDAGHDDDAPAHASRRMRPPEAWLRALTTISSTFTCHGRVRANRMQSAISSGWIASMPR